LRNPHESEVPVTLASKVVSGGLGLLLLAGGTGLSAQSAETAPIPAGTWEFVPEGSDHIEDRIGPAVSHINFLIRGIARNRLRNANKPITRIILDYPDDDVYISFREDEPPTISPRSGEFVPYTRADGEVVQVNTELEDGLIKQFFDSDDGQKQHVYRLRPDGTMALEVTVFSERLREPFTYMWVFRQLEY
jgi:hypothetical protein